MLMIFNHTSSNGSLRQTSPRQSSCGLFTKFRFSITDTGVSPGRDAASCERNNPSGAISEQSLCSLSLSFESGQTLFGRLYGCCESSANEGRLSASVWG